MDPGSSDDDNDGEGPPPAPEGPPPAAVRIPANVPIFYIEELKDITPSQVVYDHQGQYWWSLAFVHDNLCAGGHDAEPIQKFVGSVAKLLADVDCRNRLGDCFYASPGNLDPGWALSKSGSFRFVDTVI